MSTHTASIEFLDAGNGSTGMALKLDDQFWDGNTQWDDMPPIHKSALLMFMLCAKKAEADGALQRIEQGTNARLLA